MSRKQTCALSLIVFLLGVPAGGAPAARRWTEKFHVADCVWSATGRNEYFVLEPGYQQFFEGREGKEAVQLVITVLAETRQVDGVETRIVEERETRNGQLAEVSRNYFAFCSRTNDAFYFGEDVDMYKDGKISSHEGSWLAGINGSHAGLFMPGRPLVGARFYQELAPKVAMDRSEVISDTEALMTPAGALTNCVKTEETTPLEPHAIDYKTYAPGVGLVRDGELLLTKYGTKKP
jgi:hypothetical protein